MKKLMIYLVVLVLFGCGQNEKTDQKTNTNAAPVAENGTAQMAKLLKEIHNKIDPMKVGYHLNSSRAWHYKTQMENAKSDQELITAKGSYAYELLQSGKTHEAIVEMEQVLELYKKYNVAPEHTYSLRYLMGLGYIRLGEQENCIGRNNEESCILPIQGKGVYELKAGPETAISIFENMLKEKPEDGQVIWLLNIAYMTIGKYPNGVPAQWRIPPTEFTSDYKLPPFKNIANNTVVGTSGLAGGSCVEDFNNDGLLDIVASSWAVYDQIRVFYNLGNGDFEEKTNESGLLGITGGLNMLHADYNNDGFADILVLRGAWYFEQGAIPNSLLKNNGDGTFSDVTIESGLFSKKPTQTATWADFNRDGWLDLFIGNESTGRFLTSCDLYINNKGKFENKTIEAGLSELKVMTKGVCSGDVDNDGWPDIYMSNLTSENLLLKNNGTTTDGGMITFSDHPAIHEVALPLQSFPTWMWDYNNDGHLDILAAPFCTGTQKSASLLVSDARGNSLEEAQIHVYQNNGDGSFTEKGKEMGLTEPVFAMGSNFGDIDNDGLLDFYIGSGEPDLASLVPNKMYRNNKGKSFQDVTYSSRLGHVQKGHGVSFGDFDNDGDQDIFHVLGGAYEGDVFIDALFENPGGKNNWVTLILEGTQSNKSAIGARIKVVGTTKNGSEKVFHHMVSTGGSFGSSSLQQEMGIGNATAIKMIEVRWPNRDQTVETFENVEINRFVKIVEGVGQVEYEDRKQFSF